MGIGVVRNPLGELLLPVEGKAEGRLGDALQNVVVVFRGTEDRG